MRPFTSGLFPYSSVLPDYGLILTTFITVLIYDIPIFPYSRIPVFPYLHLTNKCYV